MVAAVSCCSGQYFDSNAAIFLECVDYDRFFVVSPCRGGVGIGMMTGGVTPVHHHHHHTRFNGGSHNGRRALVTGGVTPAHHHHTTHSTTLTWTRREHRHCDNMDHPDFLGPGMEALGRRAVLQIILNGIRRKSKASARKRLPSPTQSSVSTCHST